jgi:hypothetical protein
VRAGSAQMIAQVHHIADAESCYIRQHGVECESVSMHIGNCRKSHLASPSIPDGRRRDSCGRSEDVSL